MRIAKFLLPFLIITFIVSRLINLDQTINVFGDTARDYLELNEWLETKIPPLLGPHTSVISFNQSAWYFWWLMPFYLLTVKSMYTANFAIIAWYLIWLIPAAKYLKRSHLAILIVLIIFQPQVLDQTRNIWNPSLILPPLISSIYILLHWLKFSPNKQQIFWFSLLNMLVLGFSYSLLPTVFLLYLAGFALIFFNKKHRSSSAFGQMIIFTLLSVLVVHLGTLVFELSHHYLLTSNLTNQQVLQTNSMYATKAFTGLSLIFSRDFVYPLTYVFVALVLLSLLKSRSKHKLGLLFGLLVANYLLLVYSPFDIHNHYIFGLLALFFVLIVHLPKNISMTITAILVMFWLKADYQLIYMSSRSPNWKENLACVAKVCDKYQGSIYVVENANSHDHQALGFEYLGKTLGCQTISVLRNNHQNAQYMAVFSSNANFDQKGTDFYEINQFANRQHLEQIQCLPNLTADIFTHSASL